MKRVLIAALAACVFASSSAYAQQAETPDQLFAEGVALIGQENYAGALVKLEAAQAIDPGIGTQFNIGVCYEKLGKLGTAWRNFVAVQALAHASGKTAREDSARKKVEELRPRLALFTFTVTDATDVTLKVDGAVVPRAEWEGYPVDPGSHRVDAAAPARMPWGAPFEAPASGQKQAITIPALAAQQTKVVTVTKETINGRRTLGFVFGGIGAAGVVVAAVTGILLINDKSTADKFCAAPHCLNPDGTANQSGIDAVNRGKTLTPINGVAWGVAAAGLGAGAYFLLTSTRKVTPVVGAHAAGLMLSGSL